MRTAESGRRYPEDKQEYAENVQRRISEAILALEGLARYDILLDGKTEQECRDLLTAVDQVKRRLGFISFRLDTKEYREAQERVALLDAATDELLALLKAARRTSPEEGIDHD